MATFLISAACFEHQHVVGVSRERMLQFESGLLAAFSESARVIAWCLLPNHYHVLVQTEAIAEVRTGIKALHGRTARKWNLEDESIGRKVWFNYFDRMMRSERHYWATLNYVNNNAVHHGYVSRWQDWPFSSAKEYLETVGPVEAERTWREYPVRDYGKGWDEY